VARHSACRRTTVIAQGAHFDPDVSQTGSAATIRPFSFHASDESLVDLKRRIAATRWPSQELVPDASQGVQLKTMRALAHYWQTDYDWRKFEARLSALPQFVTNIDGLDIHFIHVRSKNKERIALDHHAWLARIDRRGTEGDRSVDRSDRPRREPGRRVRCRDPFLAGLWLLRRSRPSAVGIPVRIARAWTVLMKRLATRSSLRPAGIGAIR
jgi:hypothetical protein